MKLPSLDIADFTASFPLIQGGMSIRVSTSALAVPVANCGGIGVIGGSGLPPEELHDDIKKAKAATRRYSRRQYHVRHEGFLPAGHEFH